MGWNWPPGACWHWFSRAGSDEEQLWQALASALLLAMLRHLISHHQVPGIPAPVVTDTTWQSCGLLLGFGLSIPVFFATTYGWVLWIIVPLLVLQLYRLRHQNRRNREDT